MPKRIGSNLPHSPFFEKLRDFKNLLSFQRNLFRYRRKQKHQQDDKIFIIGFNKTGTTSLKVMLDSLGYVIGDQVAGEKLLRDYARQDFSRILELCDTAEVFQDIPFSLPGTYRIIYEKYPDAKYILSERGSAEEWYRSLTRYHRNKVNDGHPVTAKHLKDKFYRWKGYLLEFQEAAYGATEDTLYDEELYKRCYLKHNDEVKDFFADKGNFICVNLSAEDAGRRLADFLSTSCAELHVPHENRT